MKEITVRSERGSSSDLELLELIYKKVRLGELVKFHGKAYLRVVPKNNKAYKNPYHFWCVSEDIYGGHFLIEDADGEYVNTVCKYKAVVATDVKNPVLCDEGVLRYGSQEKPFGGSGEG